LKAPLGGGETIIYNAISSDSHVDEPERMFVDRLPARFKARTPHVIELENGGQAFRVEEVDVPIPFGAAAARPITSEEQREYLSYGLI